MLDWIQSVDISLLTSLREGCSSPMMDKGMVFVSTLGDGGLVWIGLAVVFCCMGNKTLPWRNWGFLLFVCLAANAVVCNLMLKPLVGRIRPYDVLGFEILIERLGDGSFPSGHTSASFAAAAALFHMNKLWGVIAVLFAALMGFSRLYLGVHFPTDVFVGAVLGWFVAKGSISLLKRYKTGKKSSIS